PEGMSLPAHYYIDPANHESELERFFLGMWIHAGRADQIPASGDYVLRDVADESLIVTRANDGAIHAFYVVCRHRGTRLCEAVLGTFDGLIRCPYHAWGMEQPVACSLHGANSIFPIMIRSVGLPSDPFSTRTLPSSAQYRGTAARARESLASYTSVCSWHPSLPMASTGHSSRAARQEACWTGSWGW